MRDRFAISKLGLQSMLILGVRAVLLRVLGSLKDYVYNIVRSVHELEYNVIFQTFSVLC